MMAPQKTVNIDTEAVRNSDYTHIVNYLIWKKWHKTDLQLWLCKRVTVKGPVKNSQNSIHIAVQSNLYCFLVASMVLMLYGLLEQHPLAQWLHFFQQPWRRVTDVNSKDEQHWL